MNFPEFARPLSAAEDARAQALYSDLIARLSPTDLSNARLSLERVRLLNEQGGLNWADPAHLRALGVASSEDDAYLVNPRNHAFPRIAINLPAMTAFIGTNDLVDIDTFERLTFGWDEGVLESLAPAFVEEWSLVSVSGSWIFVAWNAGDLSVLAGGADFIDKYAATRPEGPSEIVEWMLVEGETAATDDPELRAIGELRKNIKHHDFIFQLSELHHYLTRFYGEADLEFLWSAVERIFSTDTRRGLNARERNFPTHAGPPAPRIPGAEVTEFLDSTMTTNGSADERLARLIARDSELAPRLAAIWSDSRSD